MKKHARRALFIVLSLFFLMGAPLLMLYSQGYRIDWSSGQISQTGGIYIKAVPGRATVRVEKTNKLTDFLFGTILIDNLIAGKSYEVTVSKPGYLPWTKTLNVERQNVTEAKNVVLFPENPSFTKIAEDLQRLSLSPNGRYAVFSTPEGTYLLNLQTKEQKLLSELKLSPLWDSQSQRLLLSGAVFDLRGGVCQDGCQIQQTFTKALFTQNALLTLSDSILRSHSYETGSSVQVSNDVADIALSNTGSVFLLTKTGDVMKLNQETVVANVSEPSLDSNLFVFNDSPFLLDKGELIRLAGDDLVPVLSQISSVVLSPDGKKLVMSRGSELWLYFLRDETGQPARKAGDTVFLNRFSQPPGNLAWITSHYLLFTIDGSITLMETDTRDRLNAVEVGTADRVFWSHDQKKLFLLSDSVFSSSSQLLP